MGATPPLTTFIILPILRCPPTLLLHLLLLYSPRSPPSLSRCHLSTLVLECPSGEAEYQFPSPAPPTPQLPLPCIFNGHTRAADKWFLFLTREGWLLLHRDEERVSVVKNAQSTQAKDRARHTTLKVSISIIWANFLHLLQLAFILPFVVRNRPSKSHFFVALMSNATLTIKCPFISPHGLWWTNPPVDDRSEQPTKAFIKPGLEPV